MATCFYAETDGKLAYLVWKDDGRVYYAAPSPFGEQHHAIQSSCPDEPPTIENLTSDFIRDHGREWKSQIRSRTLPAGVFHPRVWRPICWPPFARGRHLSVDLLGSSEALHSGLTAASILFDQFRRISRTVEPTPTQLMTYGHEIRQLLLLACMEVEAAWASILRANGVAAERMTTRDYVQLLEPMRLADWRLRLPRSPNVLLNPFGSWSAEKPTQSLDWYDNYNATKHDRETMIQRATLGCALSALSALYVMLAAQFGKDAFHGSDFDIFEIVSEPKWTLDDAYFPSPRAFDGARRKWEPLLLF